MNAGESRWAEAVSLLCDIRFVEASAALSVAGDLLAHLMRLQALTPVAASPEVRPAG